jgi:hypothetical protein
MGKVKQLDWQKIPCESGCSCQSDLHQVPHFSASELIISQKRKNADILNKYAG